jgi:hypothetical protein
MMATFLSSLFAFLFSEYNAEVLPFISTGDGERINSNDSPRTDDLTFYEDNCLLTCLFKKHRDRNPDLWSREEKNITHTANERPVRIKYKCLVPIYVFPEMKLRRLVNSKTEL